MDCSHLRSVARCARTEHHRSFTTCSCARCCYDASAWCTSVGPSIPPVALAQGIPSHPVSCAHHGRIPVCSCVRRCGSGERGERERESARQRATERREGGAQELRGGEFRSLHIVLRCKTVLASVQTDRLPTPTGTDKGTESERAASIPANRLGDTRRLRFRGGMSDT